MIVLTLRNLLLRLRALSPRERAWRAYTQLLTDELTELVSPAHTRGWRSSRVEEGKALRRRLGIQAPGD